MKKIIIFALLCMMSAAFVFAQQPFVFENWSRWGNGLRVTPRGNTVTFNGDLASAAGLVNARLSVNALRNRTVILEIQNAEASNFGQDKMIKITMGNGDLTVMPRNVEYLIDNEYVPSHYTRLEIDIPRNFDGKLGFVFYKAELHGLVITATIE